MKQDRFLTGILIGIGLLILAALAIFFARQDKQTYVSDDTPEGVVRNYMLAVFNQDYERAYSYLADKNGKPTFDQFKQSFLRSEVNPSNVGVEIGNVDYNNGEAYVTLYLQQGPSDPFSPGYRNQDRAVLVMQNGKWMIEQMPYYNFWGYDWYPQYTPTAPLPKP